MILIHTGYSQLIYHGDSSLQCFLKLLFAFKSSTFLLFLSFTDLKKRAQLHNSNLQENMDLVFEMLFLVCFLQNNNGQQRDNSKITVSYCVFTECQENFFYFTLMNTRHMHCPSQLTRLMRLRIENWPRLKPMFLLFFVVVVLFSWGICCCFFQILVCLFAIVLVQR